MPQQPIQFANALVDSNGVATGFYQRWLSQFVNSVEQDSLFGGNVVNAANFATGDGDLGAAITAASKYLIALGGGLGTAQGEIWVMGYSAGNKVNTPAIWGYSQAVRFVGGGLYTLNNYMSGGHLIGISNGANLCPVQFYQGDGVNLPFLMQPAAYYGGWCDFYLNGNLANNPGSLDGITTGLAQVYTNVRVEQCQRHGWFLNSPLGTVASGGSVFITCGSYNHNGSGIRLENAFDLVVRDYSQFGGCQEYGIDLFNGAGARLEGCDFASNILGGVHLGGTAAVVGGFGTGLVIISGHQFGQNIGPDIIIDGYDAVNGGYISDGVLIDDNQLWGGGTRIQGKYAAIELNDCAGVTIGGCNVFTSVPGNEYRNAIRERTTGFAKPCQIGGGNIYGDISTYAGVQLDILPDFSTIHASPDRSISNYTELDVVKLGVRGGVRYLGGNFLAANVLQDIFDFPGGVIGGIPTSLLLMAMSGVAALFAFSADGSFGAAKTIGLQGPAFADPLNAGEVWSNAGVLVRSGDSDTPSFPGAAIGAGGLFLGGLFNGLNIAQFAPASIATLGSVIGSLFAINKSGVAPVVTFDGTGNAGFAGSIGIGGASATDPALPGRVWSNNGVLVISGAPDEPLFPGAAVGAAGLYVGGAVGVANLAQLIFALGAPTSGVFSTLMALAVSGVAQTAAWDSAGNMGIAGTLGLNAPTSDPATAGLVWDNGGFIVVSGFNAATARTAIGAQATITGFTGTLTTGAKLTPTGTAGTLTVSNGIVTSGTSAT